MSGAVIEERIYLPEGLDPDNINAVAWCIKVRWMGEGHWSVLGGGSSYHRLSRTGRWLWCPSRMNLRWCWFDFETACRLAEEHIEGYVVNGMTWAQAQQRWAAVS